MYKVIYWRFGRRYMTEYSTRSEANKQFNLITEHEIGFPECILDENDVILRDGKKNVIGLRENKKGNVYNFG